MHGTIDIRGTHARGVLNAKELRPKSLFGACVSVEDLSRHYTSIFRTITLPAPLVDASAASAVTH